MTRTEWIVLATLLVYAVCSVAIGYWVEWGG